MVAKKRRGPATSLASSSSAFGYDHFTRSRFHCAMNLLPSFAHADVERNAAELGKRFQGLFGKTELFEWAHANMPNVYRDSRLGNLVKDYIMSVSDQLTASQLLGNQKTRYFLVANAVNVYLANEILKITAVRGFDMGVDAEIGKLKKHLFPGKCTLPSATPVYRVLDTRTSVRQLLVAGRVNQMNIAKRKPGFAEFCQAKVQEHLTQLWQLVGPLTADRSNRARADLSSIVSEGQALAVDVYSAPFEYKFEFPTMGDACSQTEMVNRDTAMTADPLLLRSSDAKMRLGISPSVRIRNDSENLAVIKQGHLADVLLRQQSTPREFTAAVFTKNVLILP